MVIKMGFQFKTHATLVTSTAQKTQLKKITSKFENILNFLFVVYVSLDQTHMVYSNCQINY